MPSVLVAGGGLAGLSAAAALGSAGFQVDLYESRAFLGGRATSYPVPGEDSGGEIIDNCQHVLLRCCVNLLDFYSRLGVLDSIQFHREFYFLEPGGRMSTLRAGRLPHPLHFAEAFLKLSCLSFRDKLALGRALLALRQEYALRKDLDRITMMQWLEEKKQPAQLIARFWNPVLVSAINEDLDRMAAVHGFQVLWLGFLARADSYEMGIPAVPLGELYGSVGWSRLNTVRLHFRHTITSITSEGAVIDGSIRKADYYILALPFERLKTLAPAISVPLMEHSPITGIHLWFDRSITSLPHAALLDRTVQWMFNKSAGKHIQLVVSASRSLVPLTRQEVIDLALRELTEFFPTVKDATLERAHVVKEVRATFSARPGLEHERPVSGTRVADLFLAGDWTKSGWPATMEGAVRSGYLAAEAVACAAGMSEHFLLPDVG